MNEIGEGAHTYSNVSRMFTCVSESEREREREEE